MALTTEALGATNEAKPALRGVSHQVAAIVFPIMGLVLLVVAPTAAVRWAVAVYTVGVGGMYATSACFHRGTWSEPVRARLRRLDHSMIMVAIAATYTPVAIAALDAPTARLLLGIVWGLAFVGAAIRMLWMGAPRWTTMVVYLAVGWTAVAFLPALWRHLGVVSFSLVLTGGAVYSAGAVVYATQRPDPNPARFGFHEVFHAFVVVAGLVFYAAIARVVLAA